MLAVLAHEIWQSPAETQDAAQSLSIKDLNRNSAKHLRYHNYKSLILLVIGGKSGSSTKS